MILIATILTFISYIYFIYLNNIYFKEYFIGEKLSFYLKKKLDLAKSFIFVFFFLSYFLFYLRILNLFAKKTSTINIYESKNNFVTYIHSYSYYNLMTILVFLIFLIFFILLYLINFYMFFLAKKHILKLHYFLLIRYDFFNSLIFKTKKFEVYISDLLGTKYIYFLIFKIHGFRIIVAILLVKNMVLDQGNLNLVLMPYYSMYYFILNIANFIVLKLKEDFDFLITKSYYPEINFIMDNSEEKKNLYKRFLLLNEYEYKFKDCIHCYDINEHGFNIVFINTYKYSINSYPNDFYNKIKKLKPQFINEN